MIIGVIKEQLTGEFRVALTPDIVKKLEGKAQVYIETQAGLSAGFPDELYVHAGAKICSTPEEAISQSQVLISVNQYANEPKVLEKILQSAPPGLLYMGALMALNQQDQLAVYAQHKMSVMALELIPRISRAQSMDILSSQANLGGYRAVLEAVYVYGRAMPMMMTAAGTIVPAKVLILGAGVAGLQAIATARRLGAMVSAFDVRQAAKEQVESLGAKFISVEESENGESKGGYAKEMSVDYQKRQAEKISDTLKQTDIAITTALIPGKPAPRLITLDMIQRMRPGSVIVDMAVAQGGNCEGSRLNETVDIYGVKVIGPGNLPARLAQDASQLYARNVFNFLNLCWDEEYRRFDFEKEDEIIKAATLMRNGVMMHEALKGS